MTALGNDYGASQVGPWDRLWLALEQLSSIENEKVRSALLAEAWGYASDLLDSFKLEVALFVQEMAGPDSRGAH